MSTKPKNFRIEVTDGGSRTYFVVKDGRVDYFSGSLMPVAISNIAGSEAALLRFALEDARTEAEAYEAVREYIRDSVQIRLI